MEVKEINEIKDEKQNEAQKQSTHKDRQSRVKNESKQHSQQLARSNTSSSVELPQTGINTLSNEIQLIGFGGLLWLVCGLFVMKKRLSKWLD